MAYKSKHELVGKKFKVKNAYGSFRQDEIVEVTRIDPDGDIVVTGRDDYHYVDSLERFEEYLIPYLQELESKWIVWNSTGSIMATSEEDAKTKAEELLNKGVDGPVYIAKAQKKAEINRVVWS